MIANQNATEVQSAARITRQDLSSMKAHADVKPNALALLKKLANATASESVSFVSGIARAVTHEPNACKRDGHILQDSVFKGKPRCAECGMEVKSVQELRFGSLQAATGNGDKSIEFWVDPTLKQRRINLISTR